MQRYEEFAEIIKTSEGKRRISTLYYPKLTKTTKDIFIITKRSDRLDNLSFKYYGDTRYWVIIARSNNLNQPTVRVPPGIRLRIPFFENHSDIETAFRNKQY